ncbi:hypothetical protein HMPREF0262_01144 [Clostridium sp. ATCC 29733]|nr:hypothetical protein HMPREF0262_01144 [Clostridium sp. ATCC 29733]
MSSRREGTPWEPGKRPNRRNGWAGAPRRWAGEEDLPDSCFLTEALSVITLLV